MPAGGLRSVAIHLYRLTRFFSVHLTFQSRGHILVRMRMIYPLLTLVLAITPAYAELKTGPQLTLQLVKDWAKLPKGWNFGECSGVAVDKNGKFLQAWPDVVLKSSHGIRVDNEGNIWGVDVKGHVVIKYNTDGKVLMVLGNRQGTPGNNDSKDAFNEPTGLAFRPDGGFYVSDGYVNSRVVLFNKDGDYIKHWGKKGD